MQIVPGFVITQFFTDLEDDRQKQLKNVPDDHDRDDLLEDEQQPVIFHFKSGRTSP